MKNKKILSKNFLFLKFGNIVNKDFELYCTFIILSKF